MERTARLTIASAVITAPRKVDYLPGTLASLRTAGFSPMVVSDTTQRGPNATYRRALSELLETNADVLAVFQDDIQVARGAARWVDELVWPDRRENTGCLSLWCPSVYTHSGWWRVPLDASEAMPQPWTQVYGALALVWPRESARQFVGDPPAFDGRTKTDQLIGAWCSKRHKSLWVHRPSLVQHVGTVSTFGHSVVNDWRWSDSFTEEIGNAC